ncbi:MAG: helix-turn-helix transcriptional regulator [Trebonia sp.]
MRAEMGLDLARRRRDAGLSQEQFAGLTRGYSRATVSHAELGTGRISRDFWLATDRVLGTGGLFAGLYDEVRECVEPRRRAVVRDGGPGMRCELALKSAEPDRALAGYRRLGWPVAARADVLELVAGRTADVLEVGRLAGAVAAGAWLESGGAAGTVRGLPALPPPDGALAVVDAGEHWFFLVRAGFPWPGGVDRACPAPGAAEIRWHSAGGRVPMPPSKAGRAATRWAYLPAAVVQLAPPLALLDLLGWAVAMTRVPGMLRLPGGAVVAPAGSQS